MMVRWLLLAAIVLVDLAAWGARSALAPTATGVLDPARMQPEKGRAFTVPLDASVPAWTHVPNDGAGVSQLRVVERDGVRETELSPHHAPPDRVRREGGGAFCHWGEVLFSTPDGSDPRSNGRRYEWRSPTALHPRIELALLGLTGAAVLWTLSGLCRREPRLGGWLLTGAVVVLAVGWNIEASRLYPGWINVDWDSGSYLGWASERTVGYPLILEAIQRAGGGLKWLLPIQLNAMLASFWLLAWSLDRLLRTRVTGLAVFVLLATSPRLMSFPFNVLTEAFYACGIAVVLALLCECARWGAPAPVVIDAGGASEARGADADGGEPATAPSIGTSAPSRGARLAILGAASAALACTELVRPAAFGMAAMLLLPILWNRGERLRSAAALALPYLLIIGAAAAVNQVRHGYFATSSMGPVSLLGHVAWNIRPETCPQHPELAARLERRLAPVIARRPPDLSWPREYYFWTSDEYNELLWANAMPETHAWVEEEATRRPIPNQVAEMMRVRGALARSALLADPKAYARHAAAHLWGFWQSVARSAALGPALKGRVAQSVVGVADLPAEVRERGFAWMGPPPEVEAPGTPFDRLTPMERWRTSLDGNRSTLWKLAVPATLVGVLLAPFSRRLTPAGRLLALSGLGFQGTAVLAAAVTAVIARYVDAVEPLTVTACAAALLSIGESIARLRRAGAPRSRPPASSPSPAAPLPGSGR